MYVFAIVGGIVAIYFVFAALRRPGHAAILAAGLWFAYAIYEYFIANGTLCDANCNIRVDLVLFFPLLGFASYLAVQKERRPVALAVLYALCLTVVALLAAVLGYQMAAMAAGAGALLAAIYGIVVVVSRHRARSLQS